MSFKVGETVARNLFAGQDTNVADSDIPLEGLLTRWTVTSESVELHSMSPRVSIRAWPPDSPSSWTARFTLPIVRERESDIVQLAIVPHQPDGARLDVLIDVDGDPWREFFVDLDTVQPAGELASPIERPGRRNLIWSMATGITTMFSFVRHWTSRRKGESRMTSSVRIVDEVILAPADQLNLGPPHEWQTPPGTLTLSMRGGGRIEVTGVAFQDGTPIDIEDDSLWGGNPAEVASIIPAVRSAAEAFRAAEQSYLNDIDHDDLMLRLAQFDPSDSWEHVPDRAGDRHRDAWERVTSGQTLRRLATVGHVLFQRCFPNKQDHPIRGWLDSLPAGHQLNIRWTKDDPNWIPHMPWGLMYMRDPQLPIDPFAFMGMRFRINYVKRRFHAPRHLGRPDAAYRAHWLYWGTNDGDLTAAEASRQSKLWSSMAPHIVVRGVPPSAAPRSDLLGFLTNPQPFPMAVLYFFCQCTFENNLPVLWFGANENLQDTIDILIDASGKPFSDRPLVFVNACATAAATPYAVSELENYFFGREARAFLGTETLVPIEFASRFAAIFFHFFYRVADQKPMAAGEAISQTRLFLWSHYRNIGGILYTYIDQFNLFMASYDEIASMRK